jgi:cytochrome c oxidase assembly protein subunit 15
VKGLHRFATFLAACTVFLLTAGGMVTSTGSGLAVPDWPNTYGHFMFLFPLDKMVGGIFYEHSHRMIASVVGMLTIVLVVWTWRVDERRWVRWLSAAALGAVVLQGVLGGITVLFLLPAPVSTGHAALAQLFFCITVAMALFTSPGWRRPAVDLPDDPRLRRLALTTTLCVYAQILIGATMRHRGAGLAIPDFPLAFGRWVPPVWNTDIAVHFAHRVGALVVLVAIVAVASYVRRHYGRNPALARPAVMMLLLVAVQVTLGAFVIISGLQPIINTAHLVNGALVLATSVVLTLRTCWVRLSAGARATSAGGPLPAPPLEVHP